MEAFINQQNLKLTSEMSGYTMTYAHLCKMLEDYANQRVIEELNSLGGLIQGADEDMISDFITRRIKELKQ